MYKVVADLKGILGFHACEVMYLNGGPIKFGLTFLLLYIVGDKFTNKTLVRKANTKLS